MATQPTAAQRRIYQAAMRLFAERGVTQTTVSELAEYAGVARGTIYNNITDFQTLFQTVASNLAAEMNEHVVKKCSQIGDPALRMSIGMRLYVKRAHEEPDWALFLTTFSLNSPSFNVLWNGAPALDLQMGVQQGRYLLTQDQLVSAVTMIGASVISAMVLVREGAKTWREAGSNVAELLLRAFGISPAEAKILANNELP